MPTGVYERTKQVSEETKKKIIKKLIGRPVSEKTRKLIAESMIGEKSHLYKHGFHKHTLYSKWNNMKTRCYNPKHPSYKYYGGRGIVVCDEWINDVGAFIKWGMSNGFEKGLQIDRINNDGNYEPGNCRFVTHTVNMNNRRKQKTY